jgi:hypothetical protein
VIGVPIGDQPTAPKLWGAATWTAHPDRFKPGTGYTGGECIQMSGGRGQEVVVMALLYPATLIQEEGAWHRRRSWYVTCAGSSRPAR